MSNAVKAPKSLFVSHGAPDLVVANTSATQFLKSYGERVIWPKAIVMVSAHFETEIPTIVSDPNPQMIYDFSGFGPELQAMTYPAPGSHELAMRVQSVLQDSGIEAGLLAKRGYDHGTWVPMILMRPQADIPIVQLSVQPQKDAAWHLALGEALAPLCDENVLVIGSGSLTHNLAAIFRGAMPSRDASVADWVLEFADWTHDKIQRGDRDALANYRSFAPYAIENHPTEEHLHPLFVAIGAGSAGKEMAAQRLHTSTEFGILAMDAYAFD